MNDKWLKIKSIAADLGYAPEAIRQWRHRNTVPHHARLPILDEAKRRRAGIVAADFEKLREAT